MRPAPTTRRHAGFTLIELLVVIAIIAILVALISAAVIQYLNKIPTLNTVNEMQQMGVGLEGFKAKYKVYPPSSIVLGNNNQYAKYAAMSAANAQRVTTSKAYLSAIWPRIDFTSVGAWGVNTATLLEGDQCLVFFLQGLTGTGFSTNPTQPWSAAGDRVGPFYNFPTNRLFNVHANAFPSFQDAYGGSPRTQYVYAYFCSGRTPNGYTSDCPTLGVSPFYQSGTNPKQFYNPNSFQIVSSGRDGLFGAGGAWAPATAAANAVGNGFDDLTNFHGSEMMGVGN